MGYVFDVKLARLYEAWQRSPEGTLLDRLSSELILQLLRPQKGERILDIGCGTGNHLLFFYRLGLDVTGLEPSPYMLEIARSRLGNKVSLETGMAEDLPFEDNEFDLATLVLTLEFLDDPLAALREAGRVAKNKVFVGVLNSLSFGCLCKKVSALFYDSIFGKAHLLNLWRVKGYARKAYGNVPVEWGSVPVMPSFFGRYARRDEFSSSTSSSPFDMFLGLVFKMVYTLRAEDIKAAARVRKGIESPAGSPGFHGRQAS
jgi:ubiquinone/menaquinone biosynthesis C-methylase UbiE